MSLPEIKEKMQGWTPDDELSAEVFRTIRRAMPENISWWRVCLATHDVMALIKEAES